jgi:hypothetical protein
MSAANGIAAGKAFGAVTPPFYLFVKAAGRRSSRLRTQAVSVTPGDPDKGVAAVTTEAQQTAEDRWTVKMAASGVEPGLKRAVKSMAIEPHPRAAARLLPSRFCSKIRTGSSELAVAQQRMPIPRDTSG